MSRPWLLLLVAYLTQSHAYSTTPRFSSSRAAALRPPPTRAAARAVLRAAAGDDFDASSRDDASRDSSDAEPSLIEQLREAGAS